MELRDLHDLALNSEVVGRWLKALPLRSRLTVVAVVVGLGSSGTRLAYHQLYWTPKVEAAGVVGQVLPVESATQGGAMGVHGTALRSTTGFAVKASMVGLEAEAIPEASCEGTPLRAAAVDRRSHVAEYELPSPTPLRPLIVGARVDETGGGSTIVMARLLPVWRLPLVQFGGGFGPADEASRYWSIRSQPNSAGRCLVGYAPAGKLTVCPLGQGLPAEAEFRIQLSVETRKRGKSWGPGPSIGIGNHEVALDDGGRGKVRIIRWRDSGTPITVPFTSGITARALPLGAPFAIRVLRRQSMVAVFIDDDTEPIAAFEAELTRDNDWPLSLVAHDGSRLRVWGASVTPMHTAGNREREEFARVAVEKSLREGYAGKRVDR
jgi:hypothetical protein